MVFQVLQRNVLQITNFTLWDLTYILHLKHMIT